MDFVEIKRCDSKISEIAKFIVAAFWGLTLLLPGSSFGTTKTFAIMAEIAPEEVWGLFPFILIIFYFSFRQKLFVRKITLISLTMFWLLVAGSTFIANPLSTATASYVGFALLTAISYLRAGAGGD